MNNRRKWWLFNYGKSDQVSQILSRFFMQNKYPILESLIFSPFTSFFIFSQMGEGNDLFESENLLGLFPSDHSLFERIIVSLS